MKQSKYQVGAAAATALLLSFLCMAVVYLKFGMLYAIADDVIMRDIASGAFTGAPDGHLIFIKYVLGWLISRCYLAVPTVDWYGFLLVGPMFLGLAACLYRGFAGTKSLLWKAGYGTLVLLFFFHGVLFHAAQFEWTLCAAFTGMAALIFYATMQVQRRWENVVVYVLLLLTYCIRSDIFWMLMPGFGLFYLQKHVRISFRRKAEERQENHQEETKVRKERNISFRIYQWGLPAAVFVSVGLVMLAEQLAYQGEEWAAFDKFQDARSQVYDYSGVPVYEANPEFFDGLGMGEREVRNLRHYALYLVDGMDAEQMTALAQESIRQSAREMGLKMQVKGGIRLAAEQFFSLEYAPVSVYGMLLALYLIVYCARKDQKGLIWILLLLIFQGCLWFGLGFIGRLPERVAQSMHGADLAVMLGAFCCLKAYPPCRLRRPILAGIGVLFLILACISWNHTLESNIKKQEKDGNYQLFKEYCKEQKGLYFVETFQAEPVGGARVTVKGDFSLNRCLTLGDWYSTSPLDQKRFRALGISSVEEAFLSKEPVYYVARDVEDPGFFGDYMQEKYTDYQILLKDVVKIEERAYYLYQMEPLE